MKEKLKQFITTLWIYVNIANTKTLHYSSGNSLAQPISIPLR